MGILGYLCTAYPEIKLHIIFLPMIQLAAGAVCILNNVAISLLCWLYAYFPIIQDIICYNIIHLGDQSNNDLRHYWLLFTMAIH